MAKTILIVSAFFVLVFVTVSMYCALIVAGRSDENSDTGGNSEEDDGMFLKKQICPNCKTGKESYELDQHSESCPYIGCWKNDECRFYVPLDKTPEKGVSGE